MPGGAAPDATDLSGVESALVTQQPADPTEPTIRTAQEPATSLSPPAEIAGEAPAEVSSKAAAKASHVKVSAEIKEVTMPKTIKPDGHRKAMTVRSMLQGPMNRTVYFVDGGSVVTGEFTAHTKNSKKPPHITPRE